jgi:hypothetical protein
MQRLRCRSGGRSASDTRGEGDHAELVVLRTYHNVIDAELARTALESVGLDSMIRSDNKAGQSPGLSFTRGVELLVRPTDVDAANDILDVEGIEGPVARTTANARRSEHHHCDGIGYLISDAPGVAARKLQRANLWIY